VTRPAALGIGVLAQGSFLATHAGPTRRRRPSAACSLLQAVLRAELMPPDERADAPTRPHAITGVNTTRDRYEEGPRAD
jgi:hypothetical protein